MKENDKKIPSREEALVRMADLCARSEQCPSDIERKLRLKRMPLSDIHDVIAELTNRGFINTSRYARSFTNDKVRFAGWGRMKIRAALAAKRISSADISEALAQIDEDEYMAALKRVALPKARNLDLNCFEDRMKLLRFLAGRGFEPDASKKVIVEIMQDDNEAVD